MTRADFMGTVADLAVLYFPLDDGTGLVAVERAIEQSISDDPRALLRMLFEGPQPYDAFARLAPALPASDGTPSAFTDADLLGVTVVSGEALVNLSEDTASACAELKSSQVRGFIFSVVNTLTGLRGINKVRFFVEGEERDMFYQSESGGAADARAADLTGSVYSGMTSLGAFYRQPGLIITEFGNINEQESDAATPSGTANPNEAAEPGGSTAPVDRDTQHGDGAAVINEI
jgi:hypothetical protein